MDLNKIIRTILDLDVGNYFPFSKKQKLMRKRKELLIKLYYTNKEILGLLGKKNKTLKESIEEEIAELEKMLNEG